MTSINKNEIYDNRLKIMKEAMKSKEYNMIDFILYNHKIDINDILQIILENGSIYFFDKFIDIYNKKYYTYLNCLKKNNIYIPNEINKEIKEYCKIKHNIIHPNLIKDFDIFKKYCDIYYYKNEQYSIKCKNESVPYNIRLNDYSITYYCLIHGYYKQFQYLIDNKLDNFTDEEKEKILTYSLLDDVD